MSKIFAITEDNLTKEKLTEVLQSDHEVVFLNHSEDITSMFKKVVPDITIIDYDFKAVNGIEIFKKLRRIQPKLKTIMLSEKNNIPIAVAATKIGVEDFLSKPFDADVLKSSVDRVLMQEKDLPMITFNELESSQWLISSNVKIKEMIKNIENISKGFGDVLVFADVGLPAGDIACLLHSNGANRDRRFITLDVSSFQKESSEGFFWTMLKDLLEDKMPETFAEKDLVGTIYINGLENISEHFRLSVLAYLFNRKFLAVDEKIDKTIRVVVSVFDPVLISNVENKEIVKNFVRIDVPPLKDRKEDIPLMVSLYLKKYAAKYNKRFKCVDIDSIDFMMLYDWPGNIFELESFIETAVLHCDDESIGIKDLMFSTNIFLKCAVKKLFLGNDLDYGRARDGFEKTVLTVVLSKLNWNKDKASEFLGIPKTILMDKMYNLGVNAEQI